MKFNIINVTKNKTVLSNFEAQDSDSAIGKYISTLFLAGLVKHCDHDVEAFAGGHTFRIKSKGWDFRIESV